MKDEKKFEKYIENKADFKEDFSKIEKNIELENQCKNKTTYKSNRMPRGAKIGLAFGIVVAAIPLVVIGSIGGVILASSIKTDYKYKEKSVKYSLNDSAMYKSQSFEALNSITYNETKGNNKIDSTFVKNFNSFTYDFVKNDLSNSNYLISPLSAYYNLNIVSLLSSNSIVNDEFDSGLKADKDTRSNELNKIFDNNFYINDNGTTQIYNGSFFNNSYTLNTDYIDILTNNNVEAYSMDFTYDNLDKIIDWVNTRLNTKDVINRDDFKFDNFKTVYILSTLFYKNKWKYSFNDSSTYKSNFINGDSVNKVSFMSHKYGSIYSQNEKYFSFFDYYENGYKIKYVTSNSDDVSTLDAISGSDFITINEEDYKEGIIDLSVPKMTYSYKSFLDNNVKGLGINTVFDRNSNNFPDLFSDVDDTNPENYQYLDFIKQYNSIEFDETGTTAKTYTLSGMGMAGAPDTKGDNTIIVKLDRPFAYVIYDESNIPLYVGYYANC